MSARAALIAEYEEWTAKRDERRIAHEKAAAKSRRASRETESAAKALFAADDRLNALAQAMRALDIPLPSSTPPVGVTGQEEGK